MFNKLTDLFKRKPDPEQLFLAEQNIQWSDEQGFVVDGVILNQVLGQRLHYLSNRRLERFDDLAALYFAAMLINEKIDLEIATGRYAVHVGNTEENLLAFKAIVAKLNQYYRDFKRERR